MPLLRMVDNRLHRFGVAKVIVPAHAIFDLPLIQHLFSCGTQDEPSNPTPDSLSTPSAYCFLGLRLSPNQPFHDDYDGRGSR